jgi:hypothetical protein
MRIVGIGAFAFAIMVAGSAKALDTELRLQANSLGWYNQSGVHQAFNPNTLTGFLAGTEYRSFYTWTVPAFEGRIASARVEFDVQFSLGVSGADVQTGAVHDVAPSNVPLLPLDNGGSNGVGIFGDLGSGSEYGSFIIGPTDSLTVFRFALNTNAVEMLNQLSGGTFAIGMRNATPGNTSDYFLFSSGSFPGAQTLVLSISPIPEPSSVLLMALGAVALATRTRAVRSKCH